MILSLPFLLITFCVYGFIPELRNLHGKSLMSYVFGLTILYISLSIAQLEDTFMLESFPCILTGYMINISVLLCFFWLNVMCFDIWSTFRDGVRGRRDDGKIFLFYTLYAFGIPFIHTGLLYFLDSSSLIPYDMKPLMGVNRCWIQNNRFVEAIYIYLPISIILIVNVELYSITACKIYKIHKETSVIRTGDSRKHSKESETDRDRCVELDLKSSEPPSFDFNFQIFSVSSTLYFDGANVEHGISFVVIQYDSPFLCQ